MPVWGACDTYCGGGDPGLTIPPKGAPPGGGPLDDPPKSGSMLAGRCPAFNAPISWTCCRRLCQRSRANAPKPLSKTRPPIMPPMIAPTLDLGFGSGPGPGSGVGKDVGDDDV